MAKSVYTVLGPVEPGALGFTHCHEHLCILPGRSAQVNPALCIDDEMRTLRELQAFRAAGGGAIVDAQPVGCGRSAEVLARLAQQSGVHIIASTGFHKMLFYPEGHWIFAWSEDQLTDLFCAELEHGMCRTADDAPPTGQTGIRAGIIKTALDAGTMDAQYQKLFAAAARAAVTTGAPLMAHIEQGSDPRALADFWQQRGVDLRRVLFCHMDRAVPDLAVHKEICARGITLEYDTIAREKYHGNEREVEIVQELVAAGYGGQLTMGLDVTRERLAAYGGAPGLCFLKETFVPMLLAAGISTATVRDIFVNTPARVLAMGL